MNDREAMAALLEGKELVWPSGERIKLVHGNLLYPNGVRLSCFIDAKIGEREKLNLGLEHVGRKVRLRNGTTTFILAFHPNKHGYEIGTYYGHLMSNGCFSSEKDDSFDIVELLND